ncbi:MAG: hypothetical protein KatS3mg051_2064 [Anaerolineae bacterium]|nr:MAG: hypothetical protein KatS3mg051_1693 [Anaerolineae bacterium]GIV82710.1 MAG: hypothetical protein KatS3mg051_2064 [Anaerolineae bacterium]
MKYVDTRPRATYRELLGTLSPWTDVKPRLVRQAGGRDEAGTLRLDMLECAPRARG